MNFEDLALAIRREHGYTKAECRRILRTVLEAIRAELARGGEVRLRGFGTFYTLEDQGRRRVRLRGSPNFSE